MNRIIFPVNIYCRKCRLYVQKHLANSIIKNCHLKIKYTAAATILKASS